MEPAFAVADVGLWNLALIAVVAFGLSIVGGLSGLDYDAAADRWLAVSDDRSEHGPTRLFTLRLDYLAEKPTDFDADDVYYYANTGYHLFLYDENLFVWPKSLTLAGEQMGHVQAMPGTIGEPPEDAQM